MSKESMAVMAAGAVVGIATIYCYKRGYKLETVLDKLEENKEYFLNLVHNLIELGQELLQKLVDMLTKLVQEITFKSKVKLSEMAN